MAKASNYSKKIYRITPSMEWKYNQGAVTSPVLSAQEVQNAVTQNAGTAATSQQAAAANASLTAPQDMPLSISGIGQTGGKMIVPGSGNYSNVYSAPMEKLMNELLNPNEFKYDVNADGLYQQIKDNYVKQGKQAMMDTQGQSAALTGGYGNSYGAMAGQQAYQESLGNLSNVIPELQQIAWQQYQQGQDDKRNNMEALNKMEAQEYARWMDEQQLRLDLYKQFPELMTMEMNAGSGGGGGGISGYALDRLMSEALDQKILQSGVRDGTAKKSIDIGQTQAWLALPENEKKALAEAYYNGYNIGGADPVTTSYVMDNIIGPMYGYGNLPSVGVNMAGTKAVTGANGTGNVNAVYTSNAGNKELNEGLNTGGNTYNGLFSFKKK